MAGIASTTISSEFASLLSFSGGDVRRPATTMLFSFTLVEVRDLVDELLDELGLGTCSGVLDPLSLPFGDNRNDCITGNIDLSDRRSFVLVVFDPADVGREGIDALDNVFALGTTLAMADEEGLALSSSVELSTDCTTVSSAVDSPTAGAAISPLKVHVVSALDPEVIVAIAK